MTIFSLPTNGFIPLSWLGLLGVALLLTHITILGVTLYFHRASAHRAIDFHPVLAHFFRFWVWMTTGMSVREWAGVHRKHHAKCETDEDPHSPQRLGLMTVLLHGVSLYHKEAKNPETVKRYATGTPNDGLEAFYAKHAWFGMLFMLSLEILAFGPLQAFVLWAIQLAWIPFWAAGVINGIGHFWGYRNHDCDDASRNIIPWGVIVGGEELHNNHHAYPSSAKLSCKPWEFDWGWTVLQGLQLLKLAKARRIMPQLKMNHASADVTDDTLQAVIAGRFHALRDARRRLSPWVKEKLATIPHAKGVSSRLFVRWYFNAPDLKLSDTLVTRFESILHADALLHKARQALTDLTILWTKASLNKQEILEAFKNWCHHSESSGIEALSRFSQSLRSYHLLSSGVQAAT